SGPLGSFGEADPWVVSEFRKALKKGIKIGGKTYSVTIISKDTQSDPARAGQLAKSLINGSKVDLMLSTSTPEVNNPIADACEAAGRSEEHTSELQSRRDLVCRLLLEKKKSRDVRYVGFGMALSQAECP